MITVAEALARVFAIAKKMEVDTVPLNKAASRVLANDVSAKLTQPPFSSSAMDGYAIKLAELKAGAKFNVIGEAAAGKAFDGELGNSQAVRIFTGAPVPKGADCVLMQEDTTREGDVITVCDEPSFKTNIRPMGGDFAKGDKFHAPKRLNAADVALLASMNIGEVPVYKKPVVALMATGNELVMPGEDPGPSQIISSNNFGLQAMLVQAGATVRMLPIARDNIESMNHVFDLCEGADLIVTIGGASVGDHDLVQPVAEKRGMKLDFYKVAMQPGKPLMAGMMGDVAMVGLPGNPVSSMVCGHIFLRPMLDVMLGFEPAAMPKYSGKLGCDIAQNGKREHFLRAKVEPDETGWKVTPFDRQDSSLLSILTQSNALMVRPPNDPAMKAGDTVEFIKID